jgi:3-oxoacyl-[acyl-carrier protein] reductase
MSYQIETVPSTKIYPDKFRGQVAVITGAAQGLGEVTAQVFAAQGAFVVLVDVQKDKLEGVVEDIKSKGGQATYRVIDVSDESQIFGLVEEVIKTYGQIHILVHLAGIYPTISISETSTAEYRRIMAVNMDATFFFVKAVLPHMNERGYGRIVGTASGTLQNVLANHSVYIAAKAAIAYFIRATSKECALGVTANTICPGLIASKAVRAKYSKSSLFEDTIKQQAVKRTGEPEDIAHTISFIASPESGFTSGQLFDVGGGATFH